MTTGEYRKLALSLPEAVESEHMGHPDFRVGGKIFATLAYPEKGWGVVKLTPQQQNQFILADPEVFQPVQGGWGRRGMTFVRLKAAKKDAVRQALVTAWRNTAPKGLVEQFDED